MPRAARWRACGSNWAGVPLVQPPPKKKTIAGRGFEPLSAGSMIQTFSSVEPTVR